VGLEAVDLHAPQHGLPTLGKGLEGGPNDLTLEPIDLAVEHGDRAVHHGDVVGRADPADHLGPSAGLATDGGEQVAAERRIRPTALPQLVKYLSERLRHDVLGVDRVRQVPGESESRHAISREEHRVGSGKSVSNGGETSVSADVSIIGPLSVELARTPKS
jgi:hypothetical protein